MPAPRPPARLAEERPRAPGQAPRSRPPLGRPRSQHSPAAALQPQVRPGLPRPTPAPRPPARLAEERPRAPGQAPRPRPLLRCHPSRHLTSLAAFPRQIPPPPPLAKTAPRPAARSASQAVRPHRRTQLPFPRPGRQARAQLPQAEPQLHLRRPRKPQLPLAAKQPRQLAWAGLVFRPAVAARRNLPIPLVQQTIPRELGQKRLFPRQLCFRPAHRPPRKMERHFQSENRPLSSAALPPGAGRLLPALARPQRSMQALAVCRRRRPSPHHPTCRRARDLASAPAAQPWHLPVPWSEMRPASGRLPWPCRTGQRVRKRPMRSKRLRRLRSSGS